MAFNTDFTQLTALPSNFNATVDDPSRFSSEGYLLQAGEVLRVDDGSVTSSLACDVTFVAQKVNPDDSGTPRFILLNGNPINLWTNIKLSAYPNMTLYSGTGDSEGSTSGSVRVGAKNWGSHLNPFTLRVMFDGDVWESKVEGSSSTQISTLKYSESVYPAPMENSGNLLITTPVDLYIKSIVAFEYITDIDNPTVTEGGRVTLTGNFRAAQQAGDQVLLHIDGETEDLTSQVVSWNDTTIVLDINTTVLPYGDGQIEIIEDGGNKGKIGVTVNPSVNTEVVTVVDPIKNTTGQHSLLDTTAGTNEVLNGDQIQWDSVAGLNVRANGTFVYSGVLPSFTIRYRIFSKLLNSWTPYATATINVDFASLVNISNLVVTPSQTDFNVSVDTADTTGTLHIIVSKNPARPTLEQAKLGKDCYNFDAVKAYHLTPDVSGTTSQLVDNIGNGSYYVFAVQETTALDITNTLDDKVTILGVPVVPVFTQQPAGGAIQESISVSAHIFSLTATPANAIQWQLKKNGGNWENVFGESNPSFEVRGNRYLQSESPITVRALVDGEGGASAYTDEVTLTVNEAPFMEVNVPNLRDGVVRMVLIEESSRDKFFDEDITVLNGVAKVYVPHFSGRAYIGQLYYTDDQGRKVGTGLEGVTG